MKIGNFSMSAEKGKTQFFEVGFFGTGGKNIVGVWLGVFGFKLGYRELIFYWIIEKK